jgi:hypothetical protein
MASGIVSYGWVEPMPELRFSLSALAAKYLFYGKPVLWVEGPSDITFFRQLEAPVPFRIDSAGGRETLEELATEITQYGLPCVVVLDGEYGVLEPRAQLSKRVIRLQRHSMENYLFEREVIARACWMYVGVETDEDVLGDGYERVCRHVGDALYWLLVLDIANARLETGVDVLPAHIEALLHSPRKPHIAADRVEQMEAAGRAQVDDDVVAEVRKLVDSYCEAHRFQDLLPGHLVLGLARQLLRNSIRVQTGKNHNFDTETLLVLFSKEMWKLLPSRDHAVLGAQLAKGLREAASLMP